jgi:hypothetical protein
VVNGEVRVYEYNCAGAIGRSVISAELGYIQHRNLAVISRNIFVMAALLQNIVHHLEGLDHIEGHIYLFGNYK